MSHGRTEIGTSDADVDDGADGMAGCALPSTRSDLVGKRCHSVQRFVHFRDHIHSVHDQRRVARETQGRVKDRSVLRYVDVSAREHRFDAVAKAGLAGEIHQRCERLGVDQMLREVGGEADRLYGHPPDSVGITAEQVAQVACRQPVAMGFEILPRGEANGKRELSGHGTIP